MSVAGCGTGAARDTSAAAGGPAAARGTPAVSDPEAQRLLWRCRRGMKELDVILERYCRAGLPAAGTAERAALAELLALPDPLLAGYLINGDTPPQPSLAQLAGRIRDLCRLVRG